LRLAATTLALLVLAPGTASAVALPRTLPHTDVLVFRYRAHDGVMRRAWLLLPVDYHGQRLPLVISPHGRGTSARANERVWGDLPGLGDFAVVNPAGSGAA
jgi:poly(3-hydroxybutyrate) depolymerase